MSLRAKQIHQDFFGIFPSTHHAIHYALSTKNTDLCFILLHTQQPAVAIPQQISYPNLIDCINTVAEGLGCFRYDCPNELSATKVNIDLAHAALKNATVTSLIKCHTHREMLTLSEAVGSVREIIDEWSPVVCEPAERSSILNGLFVQAAHMRFNDGVTHPSTFNRELAIQRAEKACRKITEDTSFEGLGPYLEEAFYERKAILQGANHGNRQIAMMSNQKRL